ncbi:MAG: S8 family serine peptidase [Bacteroidia bacterium]|nr:S8 family serine peptidase [Bacteroidia bacterium]
MNNRIKVFIIISFLFNFKVNSQNLYRVFFKDKKNTEYNPYNYLHPKAIERRILNGIDLCDSSDFPVNNDYLNKILEFSDSLKGISRWMNVAFVFANNDKIKTIRKFPFVKRIEIVEREFNQTICQTDSSNTDTIRNNYIYELAKAQTELFNIKILEDSMLSGKGIIICIIDVGFKEYKSNPTLQHIIKRNGILATYDFIKNSKYKNNGLSHGSSVFTCIAGKIGNLKLGLATDANFLLARTENFMEFISEEENWLMAAEWADKNGADIINSSLGYTTHRYIPENMDGKTTFVSKAAQIASDKGILVVSSAGNEGQSKWRKITAPGDAEGVLTVGAISPKYGIHSNFSSYGPSADRRIKPEVTAYGRAATWVRLGFGALDGTSFSSPLVAGFAACIKQKFPKLSNYELKELICKSGNLYPYYDYAHGYGVPNAENIFNKKITDSTTFLIEEDSLEINIYPILKETNKIKPVSLFKTQLPKYLYYNICNQSGYIYNYNVVEFKKENENIITINKSKWKKPFFINIFYLNYYKQILIEK